MTQPTNTIPPGVPVDENPATRFPPALGPRLAPELLDEAHRTACEAMSRVSPVALGYRLYWLRQANVGWMDLPVGGSYAILGRHSECDAVLSGDSTLSLRHLLATTVALADGVALRLLDLQAAVPFFLSDPTPRRSVVAFGAIAIRLGEYVIGAVPIEEGPSGLRLVLGSLPRVVVTDAAEASSLPRAGNRSDRTAVTSIPPPRSVGDIGRGSSIVKTPLDKDACARVALRRGARYAAVDVTDVELELGVLIGRADRCRDDGLKSVLDGNISRGHVLLLRRHDVFEAFDLCSTQGTYLDDKRARRVTLGGGAQTLRLGSLDPVSLELQIRNGDEF